MATLIKNQELEDQVNEKELESLEGGCGKLDCYDFGCDEAYADEENNDNVVF